MEKEEEKKENNIILEKKEENEVKIQKKGKKENKFDKKLNVPIFFTDISLIVHSVLISYVDQKFDLIQSDAIFAIVIFFGYFIFISVNLTESAKEKNFKSYLIALIFVILSLVIHSIVVLIVYIKCANRDDSDKDKWLDFKLVSPISLIFELLLLIILLVFYKKFKANSKPIESLTSVEESPETNE